MWGNQNLSALLIGLWSNVASVANSTAFLQKNITIELPYFLGIQVLRKEPTELKARSWTDIDTPMFITSLNLELIVTDSQLYFNPYYGITLPF